MTASDAQTGQKNSTSQGSKAESGTKQDVFADICVLEEGNVGGESHETIVITKPTKGEVVEIVVESGRKYFFDFAENNVQAFEKNNGDFQIKFADGAQITLLNFVDAINTDTPPALSFNESLTDGKLVSLVNIIKSMPSSDELEEALQEAQQGDLRQEVAQTEAEKMAQIEPASGEGTSVTNSGFGFQSSFESQGVIPLSDIGPINPTALQYNIPDAQDDIFFLRDDEPSQNPLVPLNPLLDVGDHEVYEDGSVVLSLFAAPESPAGSLEIVISGIPSSWGVSGPGVYDPLAGTWTMTTTGGTDFNGGPILSPPADSDVDLTGLIVTVTETDPSNGNTGSETGGFDIIVDADADDPAIDALDDSGTEGETLDIDITALTGEEVNNGIGADDGSEIITGYQISGIPSGFTLSAGTETSPGSGIYVFTPAEIIGLTITPVDPNFSGTLNLTATVFTTENPVTDGEFDPYNDDNQASDPFTLTWSPLINPPTITVNQGVDDALVKEDGTIDVPITAQLGANPAANEFLTVTVTGIDSSWGAFFAPIGVYDAFAGTWTVTLAPGESLDTVMTFTPVANSDIDLSGLEATARATDPDAGIQADAVDGFNVIVDAVADTPNLDAGDASGEEGTTIPLTITTSVNDTDGSEVIEVIKIGNLPAGASLTAGTFDAVENVWILSPSDLSGLGIVIPDGITGNYTLSVESVAFEQNTNGIETDVSDNRASAFDDIKLTVGADDKPVIKPETIAVDETDLTPTVVVSDTVEANFGTDNPGSFKGNGTYFIGNLASGGVAVTVDFDPTSNTYTGVAGSDPVFTLTIESDGDYTFTLLGPVDHPVAGDAASGAHNDSLPLEFGVSAIDSDDDVADGVITVNIFDDGPVAQNDSVRFDKDDSGITGNVLDNDNPGQDVPGTVAKIAFGSTVVDVPETGSVVIDGQFGALEIFANGEYEYTLYNTPVQTVYSFSKDNPPGSDAAGDIKNVSTTYNQNTKEFTFSMVVEDTADGFTVALNNGPNPKGHGGELALFYFDASGAQPIVSVYAYNGLNTQTSWKDGGKEAGIQAPDQIVSSLGLNSPFASITVTTDAQGNKVMSFTVDATDILGHDPVYGPDGEWSGVGFDDSLGIWLHPVAGLTTSYDSDGFLTQWDITAQGWYDTSNQPTDVTNTGCDCSTDEFVYMLTDADGDYDTAVLTIECVEGKLIVGQNVSDVDGSQAPHIVGDDAGAILGGLGADILVGDAGGSFTQQQTQDYNFVFILDVSGSMGDNNDPNSQINILKDAVKGLMNDFGAYDNGEIMVHIVPFSTTAQPSGTFVLTDAGELTNVEAYLNALQSGGWTNYEDPMQAAIQWLKSGEPLDGDAITTTYFISDGEPNRYMTPSGQVNSGNASTSMGQVTGADGSNEVALLQNLSDEVIAIGIDTDNSISNLNIIDSEGSAQNITDPTQLGAVLAGSNPVSTLLPVGGDEIDGGEGADIIFGDVLFTDNLAGLHGLSVDIGAGWEVFERLEAGESTINPAWTREDTINYIQGNAESLAMESMLSGGQTRNGGNDTINGGAGDDLIFGQEGNDVIAGGAGNDTIYGGSGADIFLFKALGDGLDTIKDFDVSEGDLLDLSAILTAYDPLSNNITDFVIATESSGNTTVSVDVGGNGDASSAVSLTVLEGVTGLDLDAVVKTAFSVV